MKPLTSFTIDIHNDPSLYSLMVHSVPYLTGWKLSSNAEPFNPSWTKCKNGVPCYFRFVVDQAYIVWAFTDAFTPNPMNKVIYIKDEAHLSRIFQFLYENNELDSRK